MVNLEIIIGNESRFLQAKAGDNLLDVLRNNHFFLTADCNGNGTCGKCKVTISDSTKRTFKEVLSCRTEVFDGMTVKIAATNLSIDGDLISRNLFSSMENESDEEKDIPTPKAVAVDLGTTTIAANLIQLSDGTILDSRQEWNQQIPYGADVMSRLHYIMQHEDGLTTLSELVGQQINKLVFSLCHDSQSTIPVMISGNTIMQHIYAGIDPSSMASAPYKPATLFSDATLDASLDVPLDVHKNELLNRTGLFKRNGLLIRNELLNKNSITDSTFYTLLTPCISAYIGGDITSGIYAAELSEKEGNWLFLDIGTNGEMALGGKDGFLCASVATGPAFEGAQIKCGCFGKPGAVSHVSWDAYSQKLNIELIPENSFCLPVMNGICGSGLIDLLAVLTELGIVTREGRILSPYDIEEQIEEWLMDEDVIAALENQLGMDFMRHDSDGNGVFYLNYDSDNPVYLCTKDVHNLQLAKASVRAGVEILLKEKHLSIDDLDGIFLAGGFGSHLNLRNVEAIGMLPPGSYGKITQLGNTSLQGAGKYLIDCYQNLSIEKLASEDYDLKTSDSQNSNSEVFSSKNSVYRKLLHIQESCKYIELADTPEFSELFLHHLPLV